jgi:Ca2+/Na+ antiporter
VLPQEVGRDIFFYIIATGTIISFAIDGKITVIESISFFGIYLAYIIYVMAVERIKGKRQEQEKAYKTLESFSNMAEDEELQRKYIKEVPKDAT